MTEKQSKRRRIELSLEDKIKILSESEIVPKPTLKISTTDVSITLRCEGSSSYLSFYILNQVSWTFISANGKQLPLTEGFYATEDAMHLFGTDKRLMFTYALTEIGYAFDIKISRVGRSDEGTYRCSLKNRDGEIIDSKDVKVTVVNSGQTCTTEGNLVAESSITVVPTSPSLSGDKRSTTPSQSEPKTLEDLKMEYYRQAIALQKVQIESFSKASKLADVLIDKFS